MSNPVIIEAVPGTSNADITREFDAPVEAVFRAHADPERYAKWVGPHGLETVVSRWDFRTGGGYEYEQRDPEGNAYRFRGVFHTVVDGELIIQTFEYLDMPHEVSMSFLRFEALDDGRTRLVDHSVFSSADALDGMMQSGMEEGLREGYEKLDELLQAD